MVLIIGLPNAGKTTYSNQFDSVLHFDDIKHLPKKEQMKIYATTTAECIEGIYNTKKSRKAVLSCTKAERNVCVWIDTPVDICLQREQEYRRRPCDIVLSHARGFEPPTYDEGWDEIIVIYGFQSDAHKKEETQ